MFWIGIIIALIAILIEFLLEKKNFWRTILFTFGISGLLISAIQFIFEQKERLEIRNQLAYAEVAELNYRGVTGQALPPLKEESGISRLLDPILIISDNPTKEIKIECPLTAIDTLDKVISINDKYPFAYYYRSICKKLLGLPNWENDLGLTSRILSITTQIPGHNRSHDELLSKIKQNN